MAQSSDGNAELENCEKEDDSNYSQLTLLEKRNRNIERNKNFFLALFGSSDSSAGSCSVTASDKVIDSDERKIGTNELDELIRCEDKKRDDIVQSLSAYFPYRQSELQSLMGYLNPDFVPAPAFLLHGPSGCGKSEICTTMIQKMYPHTYARISCDSFNTSKQLLRAIWIAVITTKFNFDNKINDRKSIKKFELFRASLGYKVPATFGDLAALLGPFLDLFLGSKKSFYSTHNIAREADGAIKASKFGGFIDPNIFGYSPNDGKRREGVMYLLLDRIDYVERLEKGLTNVLLRLSELSHPRIKVIAILVNIPLRELPCISMELSAYSGKQLEDIILSRAVRAGFCKYTPSASQVVSTVSTVTSESFSNDIEVFAAVVLAVLPQLLLKTRHVAELWENMMAIWGHIFYTANPSNFIYVPQPETLQTTDIEATSSVPCGARFHLDLKALKVIAQKILILPAAHVIEIPLSATAKARSRQGLKGPVIGGIKIGSEGIGEFTNMQRRHEKLKGAKVLRAELQQAHTSEIETTLEPSMLRYHEWSADMPLSEKYLLLAAYLASANRKESDDNIFAGKQRGKRRKIAAGHDKESEPQSTAASSSKSLSGINVFQTFTLDRLASIFGQIASTGGVEMLGGGASAAIALGYGEALSDHTKFTAAQIVTSYGDSDLFASIKSMEQRNTLIKASTWSLERPMYMSTVDQRTAEKVAESISFSLNDYINR